MNQLNLKVGDLIKWQGKKTDEREPSIYIITSIKGENVGIHKIHGPGYFRESRVIWYSALTRGKGWKKLRSNTKSVT